MSEEPQPVSRSHRYHYIIVLMIFLAYVLWMMGPYLRSVIVRDAAVTSWTKVATSPIDGVVEAAPLSVGEAVGADGLIMLVRNQRVSRNSLSEARIRAELARSRIEELEAFLHEVKLLDEGRGDLKSRYADAFRAQLDAQLASIDLQMEVTAARLDVVRKLAERSEALSRRGVGSESATDEANMRVAELELEMAALGAKQADVEVRREAADHSVFITGAGDDPPWVRGERLELKFAKKQARLELRQAQAELQLATAALEAAEEDFERFSEGAIRAPPGSILWSQRVIPGATVRAGSPVAEWLDCSVVLVDVPVSDAEVSLIKRGMMAEVVLEGEAVTREAEVLLPRGSASTLGRDDLAALAKGREDGVAQVLLAFPDGTDGFGHCPVGRAAYVDFPDVGLLDVVRARLRL